MGEEEVKLLGGWFSPFAFRVNLALKLKGIPYESIEENVMNKSPRLLQYNPVYKKIPVLIHNGKPICESLVILEYMDEEWKQNPILPQDPYDKAMARFWAKFIDDKFTEAIKAITVCTEEEEKQKEVEKAAEALEILEEELKQKGKKFFGGDSVGLVDIVLGFLNIWVEAVEEIDCVKVHRPEKFPFLQKWKQSFADLPQVKETLPPKVKLVEFLRILQSFKSASAAK